MERCHWLAAPHEAQVSARKDARPFQSLYVPHREEEALNDHGHDSESTI